MELIPHYSSSNANLYTIRSGEKTLLIEAGLRGNAIRKALGYRLSEVSGCLISHSHKDHSAGVNDLIRAGVDCWMSIETAEATGATGHRVHTIEPLKQFQVDCWTVLPFDTQHDCPGSLGFLVSDGVEKLLFITDSFYCRYRFRSVSTFAVECNYSEETMAPNLDPARKKRLLTSHFSLENVIRFFQANDLSKCREIHLLHLSAENSDESMFKRKIQEITGKPVFVAAK
jgi:phosphoribosyl 1,2-cyclic phosphodiesterase